MTLINKYQTKRLNKFWGWINLLDGPSEIEDTQFLVMDNFTVEGNRLKTMKGYGDPLGVRSATDELQWMTSFDNIVFYMQWNNLNATSSNWSFITFGPATWMTSGKYNLTAFYLGDIYVIVTSIDGTDDLKVYRYHKVGPNYTFTVHTFVWALTNAKFTVSAFMDWKILLWGNPLYPANLYFSQTGIATTAIASPDNWIDFSAYDAWSQIVGNARYAITGFSTRQDTPYIHTRWEAWKITGTNITDSPATFQYVLAKETSTWAINAYCITNVEQDVFYFDGRSVRRLSFESNTLALKDSSISELVEPYIGALNSDQTAACQAFSYPHFYLSLKSANSDINDVCVTYNVINKSWCVHKSMYMKYATSLTEKKPVAYFCNSFVNSSIFRADVGYSLDWVDPINAVALSKEFSFWDDVDFKRVCQFEISGNITNKLQAYIDLIMDGKIFSTRSLIKDNTNTTTTWTALAGIAQSWGNGADYVNVIPYNERYEFFKDWRTFQYQIRQSWVGYVEINAINIQWKPVKAYPIHH